MQNSFKLPRIEKRKEVKNGGVFPVKHYSYSSMVSFSTNPIMFKIKSINGDILDTAMNISGVIGKAFHLALEVYYGGSDTIIVGTEGEAIEGGLRSGMEYLEAYNDGFINWSERIPNKQKAQEVFAFAFNAYVQEVKPSGEEILLIEEKMEYYVDVLWKENRVELPVKLKGYMDKVVRNDGKIVIVDYKCVSTFSDEEKIDGAKMLQAVQYYFLTYAHFGEEPHSFVFEEVKNSKNRDNGPQVKRYEIVYAENELFFDFYLRFYDDMTRALNGEMVYVPNLNSLYDNEIAIVSYIHRLDVTEEAAKLMKELQVTNITELLKHKIHNANSMKKLMQTVEKNFISAKNLNYDSMENHEKIATKLMEHGLMLQFEKKIEGCTFDLYRYMPSIGLKMKKLEGYVADVEQVLGMSGVRVLAPIPNSTLVGFEVPRVVRNFPSMSVQPDGYNLAIGVDIMGVLYRFDVTKAPHILVAGATGSGKSVFLNSLISQLNELPNVEIHLFDPKIVELMHWKGAKNVVEYQSDHEYIHAGIAMLVDEMNSRYVAMAEKGIREIGDTQPRKFVVIDEFGDITDENIQENIRLLAQKSRAAGIHLIIATQRPSVDIITGTIKSNFATKVAFRMAKAIDSQVLLDEAGAEKLLGLGDMLFSSQMGTVRLQGLF